ncbi:hypothetical protein D9M68_556250 [compost metagenome]
MLALGQRRDPRQVGIGRQLGEVLLEVIRRHRRIDVAVLELHRHLVLVMHDQRVEDFLAFAQIQRHGPLRVGQLLA